MALLWGVGQTFSPLQGDAHLPGTSGLWLCSFSGEVIQDCFDQIYVLKLIPIQGSSNHGTKAGFFSPVARLESTKSPSTARTSLAACDDEQMQDKSTLLSNLQSFYFLPRLKHIIATSKLSLVLTMHVGARNDRSCWRLETTIHAVLIA